MKVGLRPKLREHKVQLVPGTLVVILQEKEKFSFCVFDKSEVSFK